MPCVPRQGDVQGHRPKVQSAFNFNNLGIPAMVARPISKEEMALDEGEECSKAAKTEGDNLKIKGVFDFTTVVSWRDAAQDARRHGRTEHMGRAF